MQRFCLALDLKKSPKLIAAYEQYHKQIPDAIQKSINGSGIKHLEIYRIGTRLIMVIEANEAFSFEKKAILDAANPDVQAWEALMWRFQKALPQAKVGQKWLLMDKIFQLQ